MCETHLALVWFLLLAPRVLPTQRRHEQAGKQQERE